MTQEELNALTIGQIAPYLPLHAHDAVQLACTSYEAAVLRQQLAAAQTNRVARDEGSAVEDQQGSEPGSDGEPVDPGSGDVESGPAT